MAALSDVDAALASGENSVAVGARLRKHGGSPERVAALLTQAELRRRARGKFGALAERLLFTQAGLEQATRAPVAALHAERFRDAGCRTVADLGCGIGAESLAMLGAGLSVRAVELDPFTARLAEHNLTVAAAIHGAAGNALASPAVRIGDAEALGSALRASAPPAIAPRPEGDAARPPWSLDGVDGVFLDPARRTSGHRDTRRLAAPEDYSPSLTFAFGLAERFPTGVKLGPGLDRELIPDDAEAQWVSADGQLVETGLWFGSVARPGVRRSALVLRGDETAELTAAGDAPDPGHGPLGEFLYEPDGAVIRARLIGLLAERIGARTVSDGIAYLSGERLVRTPFAQAFRIVEQLPAREKELRRALVARDVGVLEIKKRGADVDPAALRKRLRLRGSQSATLFLTRVSGRHVALLAERA
ncbi:SAM-dependent methyltransferase [Leucobacter sp. CSA1]|uniref:SAM-dependent methyltransferase n=1 Tax=Leucobacter chromiisoli TaxID=2796471 RepID=A0A934QAH2_9MICO|nr:SAM-dependent methyltransferase [Leucobacter chromiisoli]